MDDLLSEFVSETRETLEALAGEVVAWEAEPADRDRLDAIFRFFHTVKGSCGFLNLPRFEALSHAAEDVLSDIRAGKRVADPVTVSAVLAVMDRIGELTEAIAANEPMPADSDDYLIQGLQGGLPGTVPEDPVAPAPAPEQAAKQEGHQAAPRSIRLPLALIDQLMNGVSDMVLARNELSRKLRDRDTDPDLEVAFDRLSACVADMRDAISKTRMQRVDRLFVAIPRIVRDLGRELGKSIDLRLEGGDVEMDREMIEMVVDPLTHIVRNSIDHGIETAGERRAAGKPETGSLHIAARQSGNQIVIEVTDDGRGIDTDKLVRKAQKAGLLSVEAAARLTEEQRLDLIFTPGLSTADKISAISGRGVGMDVVRANVERIGGAIALDNRPGRGLVITLRVPLTLTIIPGLILRAGGQYFALPRAVVVEILHDSNPTLAIASAGGASIATIRGVRHSMIALEEVLGLPLICEGGPRTVIVVRSGSGLPFALGVAAVENHEELVIRPASPLIMAGGIYAGMTLPDSGQPMLLLDAGGLADAACLPVAPDIESVTSGEAAEVEDMAADTMGALRFVEIGGEERLLSLAVIERVEDIDIGLFGQSGGRPFVRIDDRLLPVTHDPRPCGAAAVTTLRLKDGAQEVCYPVTRIVDIVQMPVVPDMPLAGGAVSGIAIIDGQHLEVLDPFALFASCAMVPKADEEKGRCILASADDPWAREILAPLLRQAGQEVLFGLPANGAAMPGDILLYTREEDDAPAAPADVPVLRLRNAPRRRGEDDDSIYRYDRDGMMAAIVAARRERSVA